MLPRIRRALACATSAVTIAAISVIGTATPAAALPLMPTDQVCARNGTLPVSLPAGLITVAQQPGRRVIGFAVEGQPDGLLIIVDDAPNLTRDQMSVTIDIDPVGPGNSGGVTWDKAIEAWSFCRTRWSGTVEAWMGGGWRSGVFCQPLSSANDFRSGCTNSESMTINRSSVQELWLRKPGFWGVWYDVKAFDSSIWSAFAGRSVRFVWRTD